MGRYAEVLDYTSAITVYKSSTANTTGTTNIPVANARMQSNPDTRTHSQTPILLVIKTEHVQPLVSD